MTGVRWAVARRAEMHVHAAWQGAAVRSLMRNDIPERVATKLTDHKTKSVYRRDAITSEADLREGVERLNCRLNDGAVTVYRKATGVGDS